MALDPCLTWFPNVEEAIDRLPLIVAPTTLLMEAIALISQTHEHTCLLEETLTVSGSPKLTVRSSCVLIMEGQELLGILTARDVVRLTAKAINFANVTVADVMAHPVITLPYESIGDIFAILFLFRRYQIRHLPILDQNRTLVGIISHESLRQLLRPANLLHFRRVSDVMTTEVVQAPLTATVLELAQLMAQNRVSCVVINQWDEENNHQPVGIVTERDIVQFQSFQIDLSKTQAQTVMSTPLFLLTPEDSLWTAHQEMQRRRVGRLVVSWNWGQNIGIVTQTSLLRIFDPIEMYRVIESLEQTIQQLETERLDPNSSAKPYPQPSRPSLPTSYPEKSLSLSPGGMVRDHFTLLSLLINAHNTVKYIIVSDLNLSDRQRRSLLRRVLETLEQLNQEMRGSNIDEAERNSL